MLLEVAERFALLNLMGQRSAYARRPAQPRRARTNRQITLAGMRSVGGSR